MSLPAPIVSRAHPRFVRKLCGYCAMRTTSRAGGSGFDPAFFRMVDIVVHMSNFLASDSLALPEMPFLQQAENVAKMSTFA